MYGLATPQEYLASECEYSLDLDEDNSTTVNNNYQLATCVQPVSIVDTDMVLRSGYLIDSIVIENLTQLDGAAEYFTAGAMPGISVVGGGTNHLVLMNTGTATTADFALALQSVLFHNDAAMPTYDPRTFWVTMWSEQAGEQVGANVFLWYVPFPMFSMAPDTTLCPGSTLLLTPNLNPIGWDYTAVWQDGSTADSFMVSSAGAYHVTVTADYGQGCVWSDTVQVALGNAVSVQETVTLCSGDVFMFDGQSYSTDTLICATYTGFSGCDSVHCAEVTFLPVVQILIDTAICEGGVVNLAGQVYAAAGIYMDTLGNPNGCDTFLQLNLAVIPSSITLIDSTICEGGTVAVGNQTYGSSGNYTDTLTNIAGCDSIVQLALLVVQPNVNAIAATICEGDVFMVGNMAFSSAGVYPVPLTNWQGCDSTVTLTLVVQPAITLTIDTSICQGQSLVFGSQSLSQPGTYQDTIASPNSCDTVTTLNLAVLPLPTLTIEQASNGCSASSVSLAAQSTATVFLWSNGATGSAISVSAAGQYDVTVTDANGCSTSGSIVATLTAPLTASAIAQPPVCAGEADGWIEVLVATGGTPPYSYSLNGGTFGPATNFEQLPSGNYTLEIMDESGCAWDTVIAIPASPVFQLDAGLDQSIILGGSVLLGATSGNAIDSIWWLPTDFLDCSVCPQTTAAPLQSIEYQVFAIDENGCMASDAVFVGVKNGVNFYAPNAFSPNGDGINDNFTLFASEGIDRIESLLVFDRWGGMAFQADGLLPGDLANGWNGEWRGKAVNPGVYTWTAVVRLGDGSSVRLSGDVALVR